MAWEGWRQTMERGVEPAVGTGNQHKGWEWPGLRELVAMVIFFMVLLAAALGMLLQLLNPRKRAQAVGRAVTQAAHKAQQVAVEALDDVAEEPTPATTSDTP